MMAGDFVLRQLQAVNELLDQLEFPWKHFGVKALGVTVGVFSPVAAFAGSASPLATVAAIMGGAAVVRASCHDAPNRWNLSKEYAADIQVLHDRRDALQACLPEADDPEQVGVAVADAHRTVEVIRHAMSMRVAVVDNPLSALV
jgi:hypothetical protein